MTAEFVKLDSLKGFDDEFLNALGELEQKVFESYAKFWDRDGTEMSDNQITMCEEFKMNFGYSTKGKKYLKLVVGAFDIGNHCQTSVWGFIAKQDFKVKNKKKSGGEFIEFKEGDILKSAGWNTPTLNASRGNIFNEDYSVSWTGPNYLI